MVRLIATDMDGTLLDSNKQLPSDFHDIFQKIHQQGIIFVAASGRFYPKQREEFLPYLEQMYFICDNGASIIHHDKWLYQNVIPRERLHRLIHACEKIPHTMPILCAKDTSYYRPVEERFAPRFSSYFNRGHIVEDLCSVEDDILKVANCDLAGSAKNAYPILSGIFQEELNIVVSGDQWLDAMNPVINKGVALRFLQNQLGISPAETMSFGDFYNAIEMLKLSKYSFVMENANEDMKPYGRYLADSNDHNGVTKAIREFLFQPNCVLG